jgi:hypothetical protein
MKKHRKVAKKTVIRGAKATGRFVRDKSANHGSDSATSQKSLESISRIESKYSGALERLAKR